MLTMCLFKLLDSLKTLITVIAVVGLCVDLLLFSLVGDENGRISGKSGKNSIVYSKSGDVSYIFTLLTL